MDPKTPQLRSLERELRLAQEALSKAEKEGEQLQERLHREVAEREELLTLVSHELRTPVTVVAGYSRMLLAQHAGPLSDEQQRFVGEIDRSCRRLSDLIGNLLQAAIQTRGELILDLREGSLAPTIEGVAAALRPLLEQQDLRLEVRDTPDGVRARFDALRIEQVLTNLLANAIRYAPRGSTLEVSTRQAEPAGQPMIEVSVCDEGPGVAPNDRARIFEPYVRGAKRDSDGGLGLGLAICKRLIGAHGGTIRVAEAARGGSCFLFTLPAAEKPPEGGG